MRQLIRVHVVQVYSKNRGKLDPQSENSVSSMNKDKGYNDIKIAEHTSCASGP